MARLLQSASLVVVWIICCEAGYPRPHPPYHRQCPAGFRPNDYGGCFDHDECRTFPLILCGINADCINTPGSYICRCRQGFRKDTWGRCVDVDECAEGTALCTRNENCINEIGRYDCYCKPGYVRKYKGCKKIGAAITTWGGYTTTPVTTTPWGADTTTTGGTTPWGGGTTTPTATPLPTITFERYKGGILAPVVNGEHGPVCPPSDVQTNPVVLNIIEAYCDSTRRNSKPSVGNLVDLKNEPAFWWSLEECTPAERGTLGQFAGCLVKRRSCTTSPCRNSCGFQANCGGRP